MDRYEHLWNVVYAAVIARTSQREKAVSAADLAVEDCKAADERKLNEPPLPWEEGGQMTLSNEDEPDMSELIEDYKRDTGIT